MSEYEKMFCRLFGVLMASFDLATRELKRQAHAESIEGATLAFNQLTTSCVTCHQTIREAARNRTAP